MTTMVISPLTYLSKETKGCLLELLLALSLWQLALVIVLVFIITKLNSFLPLSLIAGPHKRKQKN
uniref:Uncharacterized protein n=1 Tax=Rhizophora mucronata TaxID=61149 RepID=A0A2P2QVQ2_RHIMU